MRWPKTKVIVRGDSHFASQDFMDWTWEKPNVGFITGLTGNAKLNELARVTIESAQREYIQYHKPVKYYHSFMYKAENWRSCHRVIVKVEVNTMGTGYRRIKKGGLSSSHPLSLN